MPVIFIVLLVIIVIFIVIIKWAIAHPFISIVVFAAVISIVIGQRNFKAKEKLKKEKIENEQANKRNIEKACASVYENNRLLKSSMAEAITFKRLFDGGQSEQLGGNSAVGTIELALSGFGSFCKSLDAINRDLRPFRTLENVPDEIRNIPFSLDDIASYSKMVILYCGFRDSVGKLLQDDYVTASFFYSKKSEPKNTIYGFKNIHDAMLGMEDQLNSSVFSFVRTLKHIKQFDINQFTNLNFSSPISQAELNIFRRMMT